MTAYLTHAKIRLALHHLRSGTGKPLLLLHGLGERSPSALGDAYRGWTGPVFGLDFTGHGESTVPSGGGYTSEILIGDVDVAIEHLGPVTVLGRGLGAYVALLTAGARPAEVRGAILCDGPGLSGGGGKPGSPYIVNMTSSDGPPDPFALVELARELRPPDYAATFARLATSLSDLPVPIMVAAMAHPDWLEAVVDEPGVQEATVEDALAHYLETAND